MYNKVKQKVNLNIECVIFCFVYSVFWLQIVIYKHENAYNLELMVVW